MKKSAYLVMQNFKKDMVVIKKMFGILKEKKSQLARQNSCKNAITIKKNFETKKTF